MVACYLPVEEAFGQAIASTPPQHPWMTPKNKESLDSLLNEDGSINLTTLQQRLWRGFSPISLGLDPCSFGRYLLYILWRRCQMAEEDCARFCKTLHYMAIFVILKKFAYTGLMPCGIYNLTQSDCDSLPSGVVVERDFTFGTLTVPVWIRTSFLEALIPNFSVATRGRPRGCVLVLAYQYGDELGVYHYGHRNSTCVQSWECHTDVNPLETAFSARHAAGQVAPGLITDENDAFRDL